MLHDNVNIKLKDATAAQLKTSIEWYRDAIGRYELEDKFIETFMAKLRDQLAECEAEYANRIGRK